MLEAADAARQLKAADFPAQVTRDALNPPVFSII